MTALFCKQASIVNPFLFFFTKHWGLPKCKTDAYLLHDSQIRRKFQMKCIMTYYLATVQISISFCDCTFYMKSGISYIVSI